MNQRNSGSSDPTAHRTDEPDPDGDARRARSKAALDPLGFQFAQWLPTTHHRAAIGGTLRPREEIARRLMALHAVNLWVFASRIPDQQLIDYVDNNGLREWFTNDERAMFESSREGIDQRFGSRMGWTQENMWSLAWALGFEMKPMPNAPLIGDSVVGPMLDFLPASTGSIDELLAHTPRSQNDVLDLEDLFYCAHNAARSAQVGESGTVPTDFP